MYFEVQSGQKTVNISSSPYLGEARRGPLAARKKLYGGQEGAPCGTKKAIWRPGGDPEIKKLASHKINSDICTPF
jgi:hypothetical protein